MKHTKEQIEKVVVQLMTDIKRFYLKDEKMTFKFKNNVQVLRSKEIIANAWVVVVPVENEQWGGLDGIIIEIDDDTLDIKSYMDSSCGRPDIYKGIKKPDGKYDLEMIEK
jgi:hypothetical protein